MNIKIFLLLLILCVICTGCGESSLDELVPVRDLSYNRIEKNTVLVVKGDITPVFDKPLELVGYEEKRYRENSDEYTAGGVRITLLFKELIERYGTTVVMTTHDMGLIELADVVYEL